MILLVQILAFTFLIFAYAESQEIYPWEIKSIEGSLNMAKGIGPDAKCGSRQQQPRPQCADITDDLCQTLWSNKNRGRLKVSDGVIASGESKKSEMAASRIEDLRALIESESRLPADLRNKAKPIFAELKTALGNERDTKDWYRSISLILYKWNTTVSDLASTRTETQYPNLKKIKEKDLSTEQRAIYQTDVNAIQSEILDAKYKQHPNWKRVDRVFSQARQDILVEIRKLNIPEKQKLALIARVETVQLTLPYSDPRKMAADESCGSTQMNAFYSPSHHAFTVCAGYFNSFQSDSALYGTIAHEISHSIDPLSNARHQCRDESPLYKSMNRLVGATGSKLECAEWEKITEMAKSMSATSNPRTFDSMQVLYDCLQPKSKLEPYTHETIQSVAKRNARQSLSAYASAHSFLTLAQPTVTKDGKETPNEFFMRPDRLNASYNDNTFNSSPNQDANMTEIFAQSLSCIKIKDGNKDIAYKNASPEQRSKVFDAAMSETLSLIEARTREWYSYCGQNCSELAAESLSVDSRENFADWMSYKALSNYLGRKQNLRERREAAALATVDLCERPGPKNDAPDLAESEKKYSLENHPDTRVRRISVFNKQNAELNQCLINEQEQGFGLCEL